MDSESDIADAADNCPTHGVRLRDGLCWRCREADMLSRPQPPTPEYPAPDPTEDDPPLAPLPLKAELAAVEKAKGKARTKKADSRRRSQRPPPTVGTPPPRLLRAAALGPRFFWLLEGGLSEQLVQDLRADGLGDLQDLLDPDILENSEILLANAFLVATTDPGPSDWLDKELQSLRDLAQNHPRTAFPLGKLYHELERHEAAVAALQDQDWEWNDRERLAKRARSEVGEDDSSEGPNEGKRGPPAGLFTHIAMLLYDSWHEEGGAKLPARLTARIASVLGWFFEPELTDQTDTRIRNELRKRAPRRR